jgi:hypothetical protein
MNVTYFNTARYAKLDTWSYGTNKPNQTQYKPNSKPILKMTKMNISSFLTGNYKENAPGRLNKNKPNSNPIQIEAWRRSRRASFSEIFKPGTQFPPFFCFLEFSLLLRFGKSTFQAVAAKSVV